MFVTMLFTGLGIFVLGASLGILWREREVERLSKELWKERMQADSWMEVAENLRRAYNRKVSGDPDSPVTTVSVISDATTLAAGRERRAQRDGLI